MPTGLRRAYPSEKKRQLTAEWKKRVRARLAELDKDHRWLEGRIGASRGMVTKMLAASQNTSSLVDRVCAALDLTPPLETRGDDEEILVTAYRSLEPDQREHILGLLRMLARDAGN